MIILLSSFIKAIGQSDFREGYIITHQGDTTTGYVRYFGEKWNAQYCYFKTDLQQEAKEFTPLDIERYGFKEDRQYQSKEVKYNFENSLYFLEHIVDGQVDLYLFTDPIGNPHYYIEKAGVLPLTELTIDVVQSGSNLYKRNTYYEVLSFALKEANFSRSRIVATRLNRKALTKIIVEYNKGSSLNETSFLETPKKNKRAKSRIGVLIGSNNSSYITQYRPRFLETDRFVAGTSLSVSIYTNVDFFFWKKSYLSIQPEITYTSNKVDVLYQYNESRFTKSYNLNYLKIPFNLKADLVRKPNRVVPYLSGGMLYAFNLSPIPPTINRRLYKLPTQFYKIEEEKMRVGIGFAVSAGLDYKITDNNVLTIEARLETLPRSVTKYYYGETITEEEYRVNRSNYRNVAFYDNQIFTKLDRDSFKSRVRTLSFRVGISF